MKYNRPALILRSTIYWIWSIANTLIMAIPVLGSGLFSYNLSSDMANYWLRINLFGLRHICGVTWKADGLENIPAYPCLVLAKHQSTWETYYLPTVLPRSVYVAKRSLLWIPIFGWSIAALRFILINRSTGKSAVWQMIQQGRERISSGINVIIFPEGTRVPLGAAPSYRIGGAAVAEKIGADVLPVALNAGEFWPRLGYIKWPGEITVSFGPVIKTTDKSAARIMAETQSWIENRMKEITVPNRFPY